VFSHEDVEYLAPHPQLGADRGDFFFSPDEVANEQNQVNTLVDSMGMDANERKSSLPKTTFTGFVRFWNEWKAFYKNKSGWAARHERSTYEKTLEFRQRAATWHDDLSKAGLKLSSSKPTDPSQGGGPWQAIQKGTNKLTDVPPWVMWTVGGTVALIAVFIASKVVAKAALGGAALEEAEQEAMRLVDEKKRKKHDRTLFSIV
jgi:hypothetical protein